MPTIAAANICGVMPGADGVLRALQLRRLVGDQRQEAAAGQHATRSEQPPRPGLGPVGEGDRMRALVAQVADGRIGPSLRDLRRPRLREHLDQRIVDRRRQRQAFVMAEGEDRGLGPAPRSQRAGSATDVIIAELLIDRPLPDPLHRAQERRHTGEVAARDRRLDVAHLGLARARLIEGRPAVQHQREQRALAGRRQRVRARQMRPAHRRIARQIALRVDLDRDLPGDADLVLQPQRQLARRLAGDAGAGQHRPQHAVTDPALPIGRDLLLGGLAEIVANADRDAGLQPRPGRPAVPLLIMARLVTS